MAEGQVEHLTATTGSGAAAGSVGGPWGAAIGAAAGLAGGMLTMGGNKKNVKAQLRAQKEALQNSVSWRVADAKRAGIHPLYAMGQAPMSISPIATGDTTMGSAIAEAGQNVGNAIARQSSPTENQYNNLQNLIASEQLRKLKVEADNIELHNSALWSEQQRQAAAQQTGIGPHLGVQTELGSMGQMPNTPGNSYIEVKPAEQISSKTGKPFSAAGVNPGYQLRMMDEGLPFYAPIAEGDSPEETLTEMSYPAFTGLALRNARHFGGKNWWPQFKYLSDFALSRYGGQKPERNWTKKNEGR